MAGSANSSEPSGTSSRTLYCTGSTLATRSWATTKSTRATRSSTVVHGVNGNHDGRISMPCERRAITASDMSATVWPLSRTAEDAVTDRLEGADHERTAGLGQLGEHLGVAQEVLDLDGGVEGQVRMAVMQPGHDPAGMVRCVEEVGVGEADMAGPGGHQLVDVGQDGVLGHRTDPPVVDDRDRAVPTAVRAASAGGHRTDGS